MVAFEAMFASGREDSLPATTLLLSHCFFVALSELCGSFGDVLSESEAGLLLVAFGTADLDFAFGDEAVVFGYGLVATGALPL